MEFEKFELSVTINNFVTCITLQVHSVRYKMGGESNYKNHSQRDTTVFITVKSVMSV